MKMKTQKVVKVTDYNKQLRDKHEDVQYEVKDKTLGSRVNNVDLLEYV